MKTILIGLLFPFLLTPPATTPGTEKTLVSDNGKVHFLASTALEDIEATSNYAVCALNTQTKKISAKV